MPDQEPSLADAAQDISTSDSQVRPAYLAFQSVGYSRMYMLTDAVLLQCMQYLFKQCTWSAGSMYMFLSVSGACCTVLHMVTHFDGKNCGGQVADS